MSEDLDFLSTDDLVLIARSAVGPHVQVRDYGLLDSAAHRPQAFLFGEDVYPGLVGKAAALLASLVNNHALVDGNKRLGWAATVVFCELNGRDLVGPTQDAVFDLVMSVADGTMSDVVKLRDVFSGWMH